MESTDAGRTGHRDQLNFDTDEQDFGVNTVAFPLKNIEPDAMPQNHSPAWLSPRHQHRLTTTDVACDPAHVIESVEFRSIDGDVFALAGLTLATTPD